MEDSKPPMAGTPNLQRPPGPPAPGAAPTPPRVQMYAPPSTPADVVRERERVAVLLEINRELAAHLGKLQADGHGGMMGQQAQAQAQSPTTQGGPGSMGGTPPVTPTTSAKMASQEYTRCMRSMQANLQYLIASSGQPAAKSPVGPVYMESPIATQHVLELYDKLKALFPGWRGVQSIMAQAQLARKASGDSSAAGAGAGRGAAPSGQVPSQVQIPGTNPGLAAAMSAQKPISNDGPSAAMSAQMAGTSAGGAGAATAQVGSVQRNIHTPPNTILSGVSVPSPAQGLGSGMSNPPYSGTKVEGQDATRPLGQGLPNQQKTSLKVDGQEDAQEPGTPLENNGGGGSNSFMQNPS